MRTFLWLATALTLATLPASAQAPRRVALVIGNAVYDHAGRLANPPNDTRLVAGALAQAGFQTVDAKSDLGYQAFGRALRDFRARAAGAQVALVYYAGHGIEGSGKNWLIPVDATLGSEYDLNYEAINLEQVMDALSGADLRVVILDACRDNPLGRNWTRGTRAVSRGLAPVEADDVLVIYAAAPGMTAADGAVAANSPFATALARRLPEPGLAIQLLGGRVRDDVLRATGNVQRPFVSASITGEPIYLVSGAGVTAQALSVQDGAALEIAVWQSAQAANTPVAYNEYLSQYPDGRFAAFARQGIATLSTPPRIVPTQPSTASAPSSVLGVAQLIGKWRNVSGGASCTASGIRRLEVHAIGDAEITGGFPDSWGSKTFRSDIVGRTATSIEYRYAGQATLQIVDANRLRYSQRSLGVTMSCDYQRTQ